MSRSILALLSFAFATLLAACGDSGDAPTRDPVAAHADDAAHEPLPAPMQTPGGAVTGMPDAPGPGSVPLADDATPEALADPEGLLVDGMELPALHPAEGEPLSPLRDAATGRGVAIAAGTLPPLEDNPETGLGPDGHLEVTRAPPAGNRAAAGATVADAGREAAAAVRAYYDAIAAGDFRRAYGAWSDGGRSSGRTPEQFASAFEGSRIVRVSIGAPGRVEGAAGSRFVEIPVTVTSRTADGRELRQAGSFAMRSGQVDGAAPGWRIVSADLRELQP